jgi:hypothetical protein
MKEWKRLWVLKMEDPPYLQSPVELMLRRL